MSVIKFSWTPNKDEMDDSWIKIDETKPQVTTNSIHVHVILQSPVYIVWLLVSYAPSIEAVRYKRSVVDSFNL